MKSDQGTGLVAAGSVSQSFLARMPALLAQLGPVKASSSQAARQVAKALRAGYAVSHYSALELCPLIWIVVPETSLDRIVRDLAAQMPVHRTMIVICGCDRESTWPNALRSAGARLATLNTVDDARARTFIAEGHPDTLRAIRRIVMDDKRRLIQLYPSSKPLFIAALQLSSDLLLPWVDAAVEALRAAGFSRSEATEVTGDWVKRTLRLYDNSGPKAWNRHVAARARRALDRVPAAISGQKPRVAALYAEGLRLALAHFGQTARVAGNSKS
jgi:hypothetical protein